MAFCLGPFCGRFHDELEGSEEDEEDDPDADPDVKMLTKPKKTGKARFWGGSKKKEKKKAADSAGGTTAGLRWAPYMSQIQVSVKSRGTGNETAQVMMLRVVNTPGMPWNSMSQLAKVHTIEIIRCHLEEVPPNLNELDNMCVIRLSHNHVRKFKDDLAKCPKIERIILDWNEISDIPQGVFSYQSFVALSVLNLSHNKISFLPEDFGLTKFLFPTRKSSQVKYIDLSYNQLTVLPRTILYSRDLEVLNLSHNKLQKLPDNFGNPAPPGAHQDNLGPLKKLQKLFVSFNELKELPEHIGACTELQKIRIVANQIRELPPSILDLWKLKNENGKLDELLVDRNPLVMPSITSFEMGGERSIDQAFHLFQEYLDAQKVQHALEDKEAAAQRIAREANALQRAAEAENGESRAPSAQLAVLDAQMDGSAKMDPYYFGHCDESGEDTIAEIRNSESTLMLIKKNLFVELQTKLARDADEDGLEVPERLKLFIKPDFNPAQFSDKVSVMDLDLYFNLLVFATKPMFSSAALLFDKFEIGNKGYMNRGEWHEFCMCVPVTLADRVRDQMWSLMSWRQGDRITLTDFVAAWHIHDIGTRDPWIARVAEVLRLDYYDMSTEELENRLHAKDAQEATPQLDFDQAIGMLPTQAICRTEEDEGEGGAQDGPKIAKKGRLDNYEGTRRIWYSPLEEQERKEREAKAGAKTSAKTRAAEAKRAGLMNQVSLTDAQHVLYENELGLDGDSEGENSKASLSSNELSEESGEGSDFDAQVFILQRQEQVRNNSGDEQVGRLNVDSDEAMKKLMEISPENFFKDQDLAARVQAASSMKAASTSKSRKAAPAQRKEPNVDLRLLTDVFAVRQALRCVYRNMPYDGFVKLINFLLRGMQLIKHAAKEAPTYWHADDPTFKHTMGVNGSNEYTRALLEQMGFVLLNNIYWIWPGVHLDPGHVGAHERGPAWGDKDVPAHCPGKDRHRLDDMICLLKSCQRSLHQRGKDFKGHFPLLSG